MFVHSRKAADEYDVNTAIERAAAMASVDGEQERFALFRRTTLITTPLTGSKFAGLLDEFAENVPSFSRMIDPLMR